MSEQEKFDDILNSKLNERDFPFDEHNWEKAEAQIESKEKKRRYGLIAAIFTAGILVGVGIMYPFINSRPTAITTVQSSQPVIAQNDQNNNQTANTNTAPSNQNVATIQNNTTSNDKPSVSNSQTGKQNNAPVAVAQNNGSNDKHSKKHKKASASDNTQQYAYVRPESSKKKKHKKVMPDEYAASLVNNNVPSYNKNVVAPPANDNNATTTQQSSSSAVNDNTTKAQNNVSTATSPTANNNTAVSNQNNTTQTTTTNNTSQKTDSSTKTTPSLANASASQPPKASQKYSHTLVSADVGAAYSLGWMKEGATQGNGISPVFGISATHYFSTKISVLAGLHYNSLSNINTMYSNTNTQYDFGATNNFNSVTLKTFYYIALPIAFQYNVNSNNILAIGCNFAYLLNTQSSVVSYQQNYFGVSGNVASTKMGYMDGISPFDAQLTIAYRRKINRFTIGIEGYYGMIDLEDNTYFGSNVFERNNGLCVLASYNFIK